MSNQKEAKLQARLLVSFSRMADQDRIALVAFAEASAKENPRSLSARLLVGSSRRQLFCRLRHSKNLLSSIYRRLRK
jgi:hypothetical protein